MPHQGREVCDGQLTVRITDEGGRRVIALFGELDLATCNTAKTELLDALDANDGQVVLDMRELEFIDSTGIALLVAALRRSTPDQLRVVASKAAAVARVLNLTGIDERLPQADLDGNQQS
jgi:anti-sigma B factor antagonist